MPIRPPVVLSIAGSDSGGGAGIQADLKTIEAGGAFGTSAITSVTAQNTRGVQGTHGIPVAAVEAQIDAVLSDFDVAAVKTGMLGRREVVETVVEYADRLPNLVVDPVMVATSGDRLLEPEAESAYEDLVAEAALVTPNADEAAVLAGVDVTDADAAREAGAVLVEMGADAALVKGGHVPGDDVVDVLVTAATTHTFRHDRVDTDATHGSGCTLSSAVATRLAHGDDLPSAVGDGVSLLASAVRYGVDVGEGPGSVHHLVEARNEAARDETAEAVERVVGLLVDRAPTALVPSDGTNIVGATPYAESLRDVAAVEGGIGRTRDGLRPNRGVRFGAAGRLGSLILTIREVAPTTRFALECRRSSALQRALPELDGPVVELSADAGDADGGNLPLTQRVSDAVADDDDSPVAVVDPTRSEAGVTLLAPDAGTLVDRTERLLDAVDDRN